MGGPDVLTPAGGSLMTGTGAKADGPSVSAPPRPAVPAMPSGPAAVAAGLAWVVVVLAGSGLVLVLLDEPEAAFEQVPFVLGFLTPFTVVGWLLASPTPGEPVGMAVPRRGIGGGCRRGGESGRHPLARRRTRVLGRGPRGGVAGRPDLVGRPGRPVALTVSVVPDRPGTGAVVAYGRGATARRPGHRLGRARGRDLAGTGIVVHGRWRDRGIRRRDSRGFDRWGRDRPGVPRVPGLGSRPDRTLLRDGAPPTDLVRVRRGDGSSRGARSCGCSVSGG